MPIVMRHVNTNTISSSASVVFVDRNSTIVIILRIESIKPLLGDIYPKQCYSLAKVIKYSFCY